MFNAVNAAAAPDDAASARRAHLLVYDIPTHSELSNPSPTLWRFGARINLSAWVIPDKNVALLPIKEWEAKGAKVELVRFDERDGDTILRLAKRSLVDELGRIRASIDETVVDVTTKLDVIEAGNEPALKKVRGQAYGAGRRARVAIERMHECAVTFDLTGDLKDLIEALRQQVKAREAELWARLDAAEQHKPQPEATEVQP